MNTLIKISRIFALLFLLLNANNAFAVMPTPSLRSHPKHNMILFGENEIFASHIVFTAPHNFQIILKLSLDKSTTDTYVNEKLKHTSDKFIFLLDPMDIKNIATVDFISGAIFRIDKNETKTELLNNVLLERNDFEVIFFNELPLSLNTINPFVNFSIDANATAQKDTCETTGRQANLKCQ
ncbi:MAG: hypothetical protein WA160_10725 [Pseudobdellovibrio sp.]